MCPVTAWPVTNKNSKVFVFALDLKSYINIGKLEAAPNASDVKVCSE